MKNITLNVQGMSCGHCVQSIEGTVGQLEGINQVNVKLNDAQVEVTFNESQVSLDIIKETIEDQGYEVK
ncbi:copper chaperone CopZ [Peribacillus frigoritolerans]|jgi:copper chaperone|uniref:copper chaperone CopZ n=1 Tax=Peribacillus frigoritolerans TaxID=450367 RepID=UPI002E1B9A56|nr:copper chaperone CopZ [Peribacillus frigoritolerans]MED4695785.1 copper chaperone CopZ [Peribacillus frigoritolerans]